MKALTKGGVQHTVDFLFVLSLLGVFAITALLVLLFGANIYQKILQDSRCLYETDTALSYVREKIRQNDTAGGIFLTQKEGIDVLEIHSQAGDTVVNTCLYFQDGSLMELSQPSDYDLPLSAGQRILTLQDFSMEQLSDGLFHFASTDENGRQKELTVRINSSLP